MRGVEDDLATLADAVPPWQRYRTKVDITFEWILLSCPRYVVVTCNILPTLRPARVLAAPPRGVRQHKHQVGVGEGAREG